MWFVRKLEQIFSDVAHNERERNVPVICRHKELATVFLLFLPRVCASASCVGLCRFRTDLNCGSHFFGGSSDPVLHFMISLGTVPAAGAVCSWQLGLLSKASVFGLCS